MSKEERIQEITESLTKVPPAPWDYIVAKTLIHVETALENPAGGGIPICSVPKSKEALADFIMQSRSRIEFLLSELEPQTVAEPIEGKK